MKVCVFASGSSGNCLLLQGSGTNILIDAGISMRRVEQSLSACGLQIKDIGGVLITHEHSDHIMGLKMLLKHYDLPVYAPHTVANRLRGALPDIEDLLHIIPVGEYFNIGALKVRAFNTPHDTPLSVGYRVEGNGCFALATDMGHVTGEILDALRGSDTVLIEANHDIDMLTGGRYPVYLKRRILSDWGHLSNECCAQLAQTLAQSGTTRIILGHLSRENNTPEMALSAVRAALYHTDTQLFCAPEWGCLEVGVEKRACLA